MQYLNRIVITTHTPSINYFISIRKSQRRYYRHRKSTWGSIRSYNFDGLDSRKNQFKKEHLSDKFITKAAKKELAETKLINFKDSLRYVTYNNNFFQIIKNMENNRKLDDELFLDFNCLFPDRYRKHFSNYISIYGETGGWYRIPSRNKMRNARAAKAVVYTASECFSKL
jgi:hypothetical protein